MLIASIAGLAVVLSFYAFIKIVFAPEVKLPTSKFVRNDKLTPMEHRQARVEFGDYVAAKRVLRSQVN